MYNKKTKSDLPFMRAYNILLERKDLTPAEKLVLTVICRYWPSPFWGSNSTIAANIGCSIRYAEMIVRRLKKKILIKTGYSHRNRNGGKHTVRIIIPLCLPGKCRLAEQTFGLSSEQSFGRLPNNPAKPTEQSFDLLERSRKRIERARSLPLPALGQAKTLTENQLKERIRKQIALLKAS